MKEFYELRVENFDVYQSDIIRYFNSYQSAYVALVKEIENSVPEDGELEYHSRKNGSQLVIEANDFVFTLIKREGEE